MQKSCPDETGQCHCFLGLVRIWRCVQFVECPPNEKATKPRRLLHHCLCYHRNWSRVLIERMARSCHVVPKVGSRIWLPGQGRDHLPGLGGDFRGKGWVVKSESAESAGSTSSSYGLVTSVACFPAELASSIPIRSPCCGCLPCDYAGSRARGTNSKRESEGDRQTGPGLAGQVLHAELRHRSAASRQAGNQCRPGEQAVTLGFAGSRLPLVRLARVSVCSHSGARASFQGAATCYSSASLTAVHSLRHWHHSRRRSATCAALVRFGVIPG